MFQPPKLEGDFCLRFQGWVEFFGGTLGGIFRLQFFWQNYENFKFFQNRKSYPEIQAVLKFCEEWMKITLALYVSIY